MLLITGGTVSRVGGGGGGVGDEGLVVETLGDGLQVDWPVLDDGEGDGDGAADGPAEADVDELGMAGAGGVGDGASSGPSGWSDPAGRDTGTPSPQVSGARVAGTRRPSTPTSPRDTCAVPATTANHASPWLTTVRPAEATFRSSGSKALVVLAVSAS
ncbi:MAG TPA: hypothetical protein VFM54_13855, partial [Micromonosporaceae bacterium]|nr:hypothetical protein [Micromonosporaceae bacterium]